MKIRLTDDWWHQTALFFPLSYAFSLITLLFLFISCWLQIVPNFKLKPAIMFVISHYEHSDCCMLWLNQQCIESKIWELCAVAVVTTKTQYTQIKNAHIQIRLTNPSRKGWFNEKCKEIPNESNVFFFFERVNMREWTIFSLFNNQQQENKIHTRAYARTHKHKHTAEDGKWQLEPAWISSN